MICWSYIDTPVSGSPIVQNGKLVGAVTHVLVDDPTKGYGIFAETMLETAQSVGEGVRVSGGHLCKAEAPTEATAETAPPAK